MLEQEVLQQEDSIEKHFCKQFGELKRIRMTDEMSEVFINVCFYPKEIPLELAKSLKDMFLYQVGLKRIEHIFNYTLDWKALFFLCFLAQTPGCLIMYLTYIQYWSQINNCKDISFDVFSMRMFPNGFPSNEDLHKLWDVQKVKGSGNLLDQQHCLKSIIK